MILRLPLILLVAVLPSIPSIAIAQTSPVAAEKEWVDAKERYLKESKKIRQGVFDLIATLEDRARNRGDADKVKQHKSERAAFDLRDELPPALDRYEYNGKRRTAERDLREAFEKLEGVYLKARRDAEVEDLTKELAEILASEGGKSPSPAIDKSRSRWLNETYDATWIHIKGKQWDQIDNKTQKLVFVFTETARTADYIEIFNPIRKEKLRMTAKRMESISSNGQWAWLAHGHWVVPTGKR